MTTIPCLQNAELRRQIEAFAEVLRTQAHTLGDHGLTEEEFYNSGLLRSTIERMRGQQIASMGEKRDFVRHVLNYMQDQGYIGEWESAGEANRYDYMVILNSGNSCAIELKGCLDGNNTNIFERPHNASEFVIWSVCQNPGADPRHNVWSGIHTRLSAEIIHREQQVDGLIVWDMVCGTIGRPCPKLLRPGHENRVVEVGPFNLPPPCIYMFPGSVPSVRTNAAPPPQALARVEFLQALTDCFGGLPDEINYVSMEVQYRGADVERKTTITRNDIVQRQSDWTAIRRT